MQIGICWDLSANGFKRVLRRMVVGWRRSRGASQVAGILPLLANIYLHYCDGFVSKPVARASRPWRCDRCALRRRHEPVRFVGQWLSRVVSGYFNYYAVPGNMTRLGGFRSAVCRLWRQALKRRSQRHRLQWTRYGRLADLQIPRPRNAHPNSEDRFASRVQGRSRMR